MVVCLVSMQVPCMPASHPSLEVVSPLSRRTCRGFPVGEAGSYRTFVHLYYHSMKGTKIGRRPGAGTAAESTRSTPWGWTMQRRFPHDLWCGKRVIRRIEVCGPSDQTALFAQHSSAPTARRAMRFVNDEWLAGSKGSNRQRACGQHCARCRPRPASLYDKF